MIDRKRLSLASQIADLDRDILDLKSTQFSGADNLVLFRQETSNSYDIQVTLADDTRTDIYANFYYDHGELKPWQPSAYVAIYPQVYIGDMSTTYTGRDNDGINFFVTQNTNEKNHVHIIQALNESGSTMTFYIKYFIVATVSSGGLAVSELPHV